MLDFQSIQGVEQTRENGQEMASERRQSFKTRERTSFEAVVIVRDAGN